MMTTEQQKAYESGYLAGFHNKYDCPYPKDSNEEEWWCIGYSDYRVEKDWQVDVMIEMAKDSDKLESENFLEKVNNIPWPKPLDPPTTTAEAEARQRRFEDNIRYIQG